MADADKSDVAGENVASETKTPDGESVSKAQDTKTKGGQSKKKGMCTEMPVV